MSKSEITADNIHKSLGGKNILRGFCATFSEGTSTSVIGRNGSGKTTLLKCLSGILVPDQGSVDYFDGDVKASSFRDVVAIVNQDTDWSGFRNLSAVDNVKYYFNFILARSSGKGDIYFRDLLKSVGLDEAQHDQLYGTLSGGQRQLVSIARALSGGPKIIVMDEPFKALDDYKSKIVASVTQDYVVRTGAICIFSSHSAVETSVLSDRILTISEGVSHTIESHKKKEIDNMIAVEVGEKVDGNTAKTAKYSFGNRYLFDGKENLTAFLNGYRGDSVVIGKPVISDVLSMEERDE